VAELRRLQRMAVAAIFAALPVMPAISQGFPLEWHWVRVTPTQRAMNWEIEQSAKAEMTFKGDNFTARLFADGDRALGDQPDIILQGRIRGSHVTAIATRPDTDTGPLTMQGSITRARTLLKNPSNGWGEDRISLTAGSEFIGLSRQVRRGAPPGK